MRATLVQEFRRLLASHRHTVIVVGLLTLVTTFPTIVYVFRTDVFWHPAGTSHDVYIAFWNVWYGKLLLAGQADPNFTNLIFYPEGLSLATQPFTMPHVIAVNLLSLVLPVSSAFSLAYLLNIFLCALAAYAYLCWLFKDKWVALLGAAIFGLSPHVVGHPNHPHIASVATFPLALYCLHRGIRESRRPLVIAAGLLTGLTSEIILYNYVCLVITVGVAVIALAIARWRERRFWVNVTLLLVSGSLASLWQVYPLLAGSDSIHEMATWHGEAEIHTDAISYLINHQNPLLGRLISAIAPIVYGEHLSHSSYLGYLPLLLIGIGLLKTVTRRRMAPWAFLCALFLILRLGSHLVVNGAAYPDILLPKYYLNRLLPVIFTSFWEADHFMMGALLPLAVLVCYGLVALRKRFTFAAKPEFVLAFIVIVALEYHIPIRTDRIFPAGDGTISQERLAFLDWLDHEDGEIRLVNLPMGRKQSKIYTLYQALSGFPHAEGAISRTPDSAFDYIRANLLLNAWRNQQLISCQWVDRDEYLAGLAQLEADGFSHVVFHREFQDSGGVNESFREVEPAYADEYVQIYRLGALRESCTEELSARHAFTWAYADALRKPSVLDERHGTVILFPPSMQALDDLLGYLRHVRGLDRSTASITIDERANIEARHSGFQDAYSSSDLDQIPALWLVNSPQAYDAEQTPAFQDWFSRRFHFCLRAQETEGAVFDLYLRADIPCHAMDESSALDIDYDNGVRLHNASFVLKEDLLHFYLAWTNATPDSYGFSLQFFDENGDKALQYDNVVYRDLLSTHEIDPSSLPAGDFSIQLIVYDFETQVSHGGFVADTAERFERELEIGKIRLNP